MAKGAKTGTTDRIATICGERMKRCRQERNWTQERLSVATGYEPDNPRGAGLSPTRIANYEQGTRRMGVEEAELLATIFTEYHAAYFLGLIDEREARMLALMRSGDGPPRHSSVRKAG